MSFRKYRTLIYFKIIYTLLWIGTVDLEQFELICHPRESEQARVKGAGPNYRLL